MPSTLIIESGSGAIQIEEQPGTYLQVYYGITNEPLPKSVLYSVDGGVPTEPLPLSGSLYQVSDNPFRISYDMGNCTAMMLDWRIPDKHQVDALLKEQADKGR